ncbi:unnamed protein product [Polarella glacialis]|uniref:Uncharacterized protein n=1 Tax=Polarella glacialis TaxID=89957 RepID=A0A813DR22_POLGL|nr:unnamed protein product [Polarella glacialis]
MRQVEHDKALDSLGSELQELQLHKQRLEPLQADERKLVWRLKREYTLVRREAELAARALDHQDRENERSEARCSEDAEYSRGLEIKAAELISECPGAQRQLEEEGEVANLRAQRRELLSEIRTLHVNNREKEQHAWKLSSAAELWAESVLPPNFGASALRSLGMARMEVEDAFLQLAEAGKEASRAAEMREVSLLAMHGVMQEHREHVAQLASCESEVLAARAKRGVHVAEATVLREAVRHLSEERSLLSAECDEQRTEMRSWRQEVDQLDELETALRGELSGAQLLASQSAKSNSDVERRVLDLDQELSVYLADRREIQSSDVQDMALQDAMSGAVQRKTLQLQTEVNRMQAAHSELHVRNESAELRLRETLLPERTSQRRTSEALVSSRDALISSCRELGERLTQERFETETLRRRARQMLHESQVAEQSLIEAKRRREVSLASAALESRQLESKGIQLQARLAARDTSQAALAHAITEASQRLGRLRQSQEEAASEVAALRRQNASLETLVSFG